MQLSQSTHIHNTHNLKDSVLHKYFFLSILFGFALSAQYLKRLYIMEGFVCLLFQLLFKEFYLPPPAATFSLSLAAWALLWASRHLDSA